jgi:hypothetical protein
MMIGTSVVGGGGGGEGVLMGLIFIFCFTRKIVKAILSKNFKFETLKKRWSFLDKKKMVSTSSITF